MGPWVIYILNHESSKWAHGVYIFARYGVWAHVSFYILSYGSSGWAHGIPHVYNHNISGWAHGIEYILAHYGHMGP